MRPANLRSDNLPDHDVGLVRGAARLADLDVVLVQEHAGLPEPGIAALQAEGQGTPLTDKGACDYKEPLHVVLLRMPCALDKPYATNPRRPKTST